MAARIFTRMTGGGSGIHKNDGMDGDLLDDGSSAALERSVGLITIEDS